MDSKVEVTIIGKEPEDRPDRYRLAFHLHDTKTGKRARYVDEFLHADLEPFIWFDGNFACDCNRSAFMGYPVDEQYECGHFIVLERVEVVQDLLAGQT